MNTFLPYADFNASARCLDYRRLGKQRVESFQILNTIENGGGWRHHPCVKMWIGYENALILYMNACILEWVKRGYKNTMKLIDVKQAVMPLWLGDERLHSSHRSNLLRKFPEFYEKYGWKEPLILKYFWPTPIF